jgi:hypothetical protein
LLFRLTYSFLCLACGIILLASAPACATDQAQVKAGLKTVLALADKSGPSTLVAVLYDPHDPASQADAEAIVASITSGDAVPPGLKLTAQAMTLSSYSWIAHPKVAFLAQGFPQSAFPEVARISSLNGALTISTDLECVKAHECVLGVKAQPSVQIYYSPAAAEASRISFTPALIMLANQV